MRSRTAQLTEQRAIRIAAEELLSGKEKENRWKAKWEHEKRRASYAAMAPPCCFCGARKVGYWETPDRADYDQWCGECEIKPTDIMREAFRARRIALIDRTFAAWSLRRLQELHWLAVIERRAPKSGYRGVYEHQGRPKRFEAKFRGRSLGHFATVEQAARAYNDAAANRLGHK